MKTLIVPEKRWGSVTEFLTQFPHLKVALFLSIYPYSDIDFMSHTVLKGVSAWGVKPEDTGRTYPAGRVPQWEKDKRIQAMQNQVKYVFSKEMPLEVNAYLKPEAYYKDKTYDAWDSTGGMSWQQTERIYPSVDDITARQMIRTLQYLDQPVMRTFGLYNFVVLKLLYPEKWKYVGENLAKRVGSIGRSWRILYETINTYWETVVDDFLKYKVANLEVYSMEKPVSLREVYGILDIKKLPPKTISYVMTGDPPPLDGVDWKSVDPWSRIFASVEARSLLQAAAELYPVKVPTVAPFPKPPSSFRNESDAKRAKLIFKYVLNNFKVTVDPDLRIVIAYHRQSVMETVTWSLENKRTWRDYVGYAILGTLAAVTVVGVSAGVMAAVKGVPLVGGATHPATAASALPSPASKAASMGVAAAKAPTVASVAKATAPIATAPSVAPAAAKAGVATLKTAPSAVAVAKGLPVAGKALETAKTAGRVLTAVAPVAEGVMAVKAVSESNKLSDTMPSSTSGTKLRADLQSPRTPGLMVVGLGVGLLYLVMTK